MMGPGWANEAFKDSVTVFVICLVVMLGIGVGVGCLIQRCDGHPAIVWKKK